MYTTNQNYEINSIVYTIDRQTGDVMSGRVVQVTIDLYLNSGILASTITYNIELIDGIACSAIISVPEGDLFATAEDTLASSG